MKAHSTGWPVLDRYTSCVVVAFTLDHFCKWSSISDQFFQRRHAPSIPAGCRKFCDWRCSAFRVGRRLYYVRRQKCNAPVPL